MESVKKFVAYYRVSTQKQGNSGLGLEGQKASVKTFIGTGVLVSEFTEIESGKNNNRKELEKAIEATKQNGATLIIAKLSRLSRNAYFVMKLQSEKVSFVCCDNPTANDLTIGILAVVAQHEAKEISERTKAALDALKERRKTAKENNTPYLNSKQVLTSVDKIEWRKGVWTDNARQKGKETLSKKAAENKDTIRAKKYANDLKKDGLTLEAIANKLNDYGFQTARKGTFHKTSVMRLLAE